MRCGLKVTLIAHLTVGSKLSQHDGDVGSDDDEQSNNGTAKDQHHQRSRRSVVVEIEPAEQQLPANERDMLDTYLAWRETNGYGTLAGRWG